MVSPDLIWTTDVNYWDDCIQVIDVAHNISDILLLSLGTVLRVRMRWLNLRPPNVNITRHRSCSKSHDISIKRGEFLSLARDVVNILVCKLSEVRCLEYRRSFTTRRAIFTSISRSRRQFLTQHPPHGLVVASPWSVTRHAFPLTRLN